ncbi:exocyst subunit, partial [Cymbomonas tetramitiformis]
SGAVRDFLERFGVESFMPHVEMEYRTRVSEVLNQEDALRPVVRPRGCVYTSNVTEGRPIFPALLTLQSYIAQMLMWVKAMPPIAAMLSCAYREIASRFVEGCEAKLKLLTAGSTCAELYAIPEVAACMEGNVAHPLHKELLGKEQITQDDLWSISPTKSSGILVNLGTLSDNLEFFADALSLLVPAPQLEDPLVPAGNEMLGVTARCRVVSSKCLHHMRLEIGLQGLFYLSRLWRPGVSSQVDPVLQEAEMQDCSVSMTHMLDRVQNILQ